MIEPVHPFEGGEFHGLCMTPWPPAMKFLGLEQAVDGFGEGILAAVADAADGWFDPGVCQAFRVAKRRVLNAAIAMMNQLALSRRAAIMQRLLQGMQHKSGLSRSGNAPADNAAGKDVDDKGNSVKSLPGGDIDEIGNPQGIGPSSAKLPIDPVPGARGGRIADRRLHGLAADHPRKPICFIKRAVVQRATSMPSRCNCRQTLRTP